MVTVIWLSNLVTAKLHRNCTYLYETSITVVKVPLGSVADTDFFVSQSSFYCPLASWLDFED